MSLVGSFAAVAKLLFTTAAATEPCCRAFAVCDASSGWTSTFDDSMSVVVENALPPSLSSRSFADCRMSSARAWLIESFGIATFAFAGSSLGFL